MGLIFGLIKGVFKLALVFILFVVVKGIIIGEIEIESKDVKKYKNAGISAAIVLVLAITFSSLIEIVPNGHRGIKYNINGGVEDTILTEGWHIVKPVLKVTDFPVYVQTLALTSDTREGSEGDDSFLVPSKDGKQVRVGIEMNYRFEEEKLPSIFKKYGGKTPRQIESYHMKGKVKAWSSEATTKYPIIELYGEKKTEATQEALKIMQDRFAAEGIIVESFEFVEITPDEQSMKAIQDRVNASQELETAKTRQKQAEVEAHTKIIQAEAKAKAKIAEAEGEKRANELTQQSLTEGILRQQWIDKWDGKLPDVTGNQDLMLNMK